MAICGKIAESSILDREVFVRVSAIALMYYGDILPWHYFFLYAYSGLGMLIKRYDLQAAGGA